MKFLGPCSTCSHFKPGIIENYYLIKLLHNLPGGGSTTSGIRYELKDWGYIIVEVVSLQWDCSKFSLNTSISFANFPSTNYSRFVNHPVTILTSLMKGLGD
jgi:hypothetical protein